MERHNQLITVAPFRARYKGATGDVVIGQVSQIGNKRWKVDIGATQDAVLALNAVELPDGQHRIRSEDDQLMMRDFYNVGDYLSVRDT